ncbi:MAG: hypothetical protein AB7V77_05160 [Candidatus Woesearchaeota archaeon]
MAKEASKEEQIGFHKGSLSTLAKEREEFTRILGIVEQLIKMHMTALADLGVDVEAMAKEGTPEPKKEKKKPIEDIL